jgi:hypothetical protein
MYSSFILEFLGTILGFCYIYLRISSFASRRLFIVIGVNPAIYLYLSKEKLFSRINLV